VKICFTGGGTGGHVFPAFAIDAELRHLLPDNYTRFWIGSGQVQERRWVEAANFPYYAIKSGKLRRYFAWKTISDAFAVLIGIIQAFKILRRERPHLLFSKGGYVSVPPVIAAWFLRIPSVTHESDALPGLATKINSLFATKICIPFEEVAQEFKPRRRKKLVVTGVPTRFSLERAQHLYPIKEGKKRLLVLGGSQGAAQINALIWENLERLLPLCDIIHQTGSGKLQVIEKPGYHATQFFHSELEEVIGGATAVISRAGATAIADFLELQKPMILVPLNLKASRGDQLANAKRLEEAGAALVISGEDGEELIQAVTKVLNEEGFKEEMVERGKTLYSEGAQKRIAHLLIGIKGERNG